MRLIGRVFDRQSSSVFSVISPTGGIRPPDRRRGRSALSLSEREEISRGLSTKQSLRVIARQLGRVPSTISREVRRNCGRARYRATASDQAAWRGRCSRFMRMCFAGGQRGKRLGSSVTRNGSSLALQSLRFILPRSFTLRVPAIGHDSAMLHVQPALRTLASSMLSAVDPTYSVRTKTFIRLSALQPRSDRIRRRTPRVDHNGFQIWFVDKHAL